MADEFIRPSGDTTLDGWTDEADGTTTIYTKIDESTAGDSDFVQSPVIEASQADLVVRLLQGTTEIAEWPHTDISETFATAEQTLSAPELASISDFNDLNIELDDNAGSVYKFALGDPAGALTTPVVVRYRYKKLLVEEEEGGGPGTTWDPTELSGTVTLSGGDLTATGDLTAGWDTIITVARQSSGKFYCEFQPTAISIAAWHAVGVSQENELTNPIGSTSKSFAWFANGEVWTIGAAVTTVDPYGVNDWIAMAVDFDAMRIWFKNITDAGTWNDTGADPAAGTGGIDISGMVLPPFGAAATLSYNQGDVNTANFGDTTYQATPPSGFVNWGS